MNQHWSIELLGEDLREVDTYLIISKLRTALEEQRAKISAPEMAPRIHASIIRQRKEMGRPILQSEFDSVLTTAIKEALSA